MKLYPNLGQFWLPNRYNYSSVIDPRIGRAIARFWALTELQMEPDQDTRLSELLDRSSAGVITEYERLELQALMQIYQEGLLGKATALSEAVKRGLVI